MKSDDTELGTVEGADGILTIRGGAGRVRHEYGPALEHTLENEAGDFIFIEPGVPHEVFNMSDTELVMAVVARSDASEWENIVNFDRPKR